MYIYIYTCIQIWMYILYIYIYPGAIHILLCLQRSSAPMGQLHRMTGHLCARRGVFKGWMDVPWSLLVGGWATPLKNMNVNWDDDIPNINGKIKLMFQTTNKLEISVFSIFSILSDLIYPQSVQKNCPSSTIPWNMDRLTDPLFTYRPQWFWNKLEWAWFSTV